MWGSGQSGPLERPPCAGWSFSLPNGPEPGVANQRLSWRDGRTHVYQEPLIRPGLTLEFSQPPGRGALSPILLYVPFCRCDN